MTRVSVVYRLVTALTLLVTLVLAKEHHLQQRAPHGHEHEEEEEHQDVTDEFELITPSDLTFESDDSHEHEEEEEHHDVTDEFELITPPDLAYESDDNLTLACPETRKDCAEMGGSCQAKTMPCQGMTKSKLCEGRKCACCLPCIEKKTYCSKKNGTCQANKMPCPGEKVGLLCKRGGCTCCLPGALLCLERKKKECTAVGGICQSKEKKCPGEKVAWFCKGGACTCCLPTKAVCDPICMNGGICLAHNVTGESHCACTDFWQGPTCEIHVCESDSSCMNGGTCLKHFGEEPNHCACTDSWTGQQCEIPVCDSPCLNGGTCLAHDGSEPHSCKCRDSWIGTQCEIPVCDSPCMNGGTCLGHFGPDPHHCTCTDSWTGPTCEIPVCDSTCENGGTCSKPNTCTCTDSWTGKTCEKPLCDPACLNGGTCLTHSGSEPNNCTCTDSWTGPTCEKAVCDSSCENGGTCSAPNICTCTDSWGGPTCKTPVCDSPCMNGGTCSAPNTCTCAHSWTGTTCEIPVCDSPCMNGGTCSAPNSCTCANSWTGPTCEIPECDSPCMNGGTCLAHFGDDNNHCTCTDSWTGLTCEIPVCDSKCENGGKCSAPNKCTCTGSWTGPTCKISACVSAGGVHIGSQCLNISSEDQTWDKAAEACASRGGSLATLEDPDNIRDYLAENNAGVTFWAGGSDMANEGSWVWMSGKILDQSLWADGQPQDFSSDDEDCLGVSSQRGYHDYTCADMQRYICELGDCAIAGGVHIGSQCLTFSKESQTWDKAAAACASRNGILATLEDPHKIEAYLAKNNEGVTFWAGGSDMANEGSWVWMSGKTLDQSLWAEGQPQDFSSDDEDCLGVTSQHGYHDYTCADNHRYICELGDCAIAGGVHIGNQCLNFSTESQTWDQAAEACASRSGILATLDDPDKIRAYLAENNAGVTFWAGGSDMANEGSWVWMSGKIIDQNLWAEGQPQDFSSDDEDCLGVSSQRGYHDYTCADNRRYICELATTAESSATEAPKTEAKGPTRDPDLRWEEIGDDMFVMLGPDITWDDAQTRCRMIGLDLYQPHNIVAVAEHLEETYSNNWYWFGARGNGTHQIWTKSGEALTMEDPWYAQTYTKVGINDCVELIAFKPWTEQKTVLDAVENSCDRMFHFICG